MAEKVNFTPTQQKILDSTDKNLLVSASAGTGKTTVMVERIKRLIQNCHAQIDRMLIVTFTKLAASEMKEKLHKILADCEDYFVQEQISLIDASSIGTIHSFCADVIREYFYIVGIDPNFSVLKEEESVKLFERATDMVFEKRYREGTELFDVVEKFCGERDDKTLRQNVKRLHDFYGGVENLTDWQEKTLAEYDDNAIKDYFNKEFAIKKTTELKSRLFGLCLLVGEVGADILAQRLEHIREELTANDKCDLEQNLIYLSQAKIPVRPKNFRDKVFFNCDPDRAEDLWVSCLEAEDAVKEFIKTAKVLLQAVQNPSAEEKVKEYCRYNVRLAENVEKVFSQLKREKNVVDFSDMEKMTLSVLKDQLSAEQIRNRYDYVFVDEYQDVNGIQEKIIQLVTKPNALFAVGDVKQSIYGFRQADPDIFVGKTDEYLLDEKNNLVVYMNDNFRCCKSIGDFVNDVFYSTMTRNFGKVDYRATSMLVANKDSSVCDGELAVETVYIDNQKAEKNIQQGLYDLSCQEEETVTDGKAEGAFIAKRIKELLGKEKEDGKKITYSDIVVLRRSVKGDAIDLYKQLLSEGIPAVIKLDEEDCYKEINDIIAFFKVINNRYDDYALATALTSPLGKMDYDDLAVISRASQKTYLWQKTCEYAEKTVDLKDDYQIKLAQTCRKFMDLVQKYQTLSAVVKIGRLLLQLFEETEYEKFVLALPNGNLRKERLLAYCSQMAGLGLQEFLDTSFNAEEVASANIVGDAVRIMTIHVSKGLEFDVVFLAGLDSPFSTKNKGNLVMSKQYGLGARLSEEGEVYDSLREKFLVELNLKKQKEEELRLLYVGATRAKRKLICSMVGRKHVKSEFFMPWNATKMQEWLPTAENSIADFAEKNLCLTDVLEEEATEKVVADTNEYDAIPQNLLDYFDNAIKWQYPHKEWLDLPLKVVSSKLDGEKIQHNRFEEEQTDSVEQQVFLTGEEKVEAKSAQNQTATATPITTVATTHDTDKTELGKAYHKIFEIIDLSKPTMEKLSESLAWAVKNGWITEQTAKQVDLTILQRVLTSEEFTEIIKDAKIYRETPFLTTLPYNQLFGEGAEKEVMLQGVIDMLVIKQKENRAIVVDFKITGNSAKVKERYEKQLNSYALAVQKCLKLPTSACVLSVLDGKLVKF